MSKVPAHWELMPSIKKLRDEIAPQTLLIGNGDVENRQHGLRLIAKTGIDGVMMGRAVFTSIFAFETEPKQHSQSELLQMLQYHLDLFERQHSEVQVRKDGTTSLYNKPYETLKRFFKVYIRDFPGSSELRVKLMETTTIPEAREVLFHYGT